MNRSAEEIVAASSTGEAAVGAAESSELCLEGERLLAEGNSEAALSCLSRAHALSASNARVRSYLGLAIARVESDFSRARDLCEGAARQEFFSPHSYLNLARVYLHFGRRSEALRYLRRGQMIDPGNREITGLILSLGRRRVPLVPFLPRRHPINRALGTARSRVMGALARA